LDDLLYKNLNKSRDFLLENKMHPLFSLELDECIPGIFDRSTRNKDYSDLLSKIGPNCSKLQGKQDRIYFLHDSARRHIAKSMREKLLKLGWVTVPHPPYSPDLAPTDYHLYRSLSNHLHEKKFDDENYFQMDLLNFFGEKSQDFYERGILSLPERWRQVIDSNGAYIVKS
jgi:hypothetical protein